MPGATVDLATGDARPPDLADHLTMGVDVDYDPDARSDLFDHFLETIFAGDADLIAYVQRLLGYCLTGVVNEHILPVGYGTGANGKSTLFGVLQDILGDHAVTAPEGLIIHRATSPTRSVSPCFVAGDSPSQEELDPSSPRRSRGEASDRRRHVSARECTATVQLPAEPQAPRHQPPARVRGGDVAIWRRLGWCRSR